MTARAETRLVRFSPVELVDAVRAGRFRYPDPPSASAADTACMPDGLRRGFPVHPLLLRQAPAEPVLWVLDGGDLVAALLRATGHTEWRPEEKPLRPDVDTGAVVSWGTAALAPAHDLLSVTVDERFGTAPLAFRLGGERMFDHIGRDRFRRPADTVGADHCGAPGSGPPPGVPRSTGCAPSRWRADPRTG